MPLSPREKQILDSIIVASENDPQRPEFPADNPKFPATPTYQIDVPGFSNVWLKDESHNPTGTHKDRMAREIVVTYRDFLWAKQRGQISGSLPSMSIISSWSAAVAIQTQLAHYQLPDLHVLVDTSLDHTIVDAMKQIGCKVFFTHLSEKALGRNDILTLTNNQHWFDITSSNALDPTTKFYDRLSYEIINSSPDYCFIPFGTGNLFENILNVNKKELTAQYHDRRFSWDVDLLRHCHFIGATTNNKSSKAQKLYSPHLPFVCSDEQRIKLYRYAGFCGAQSDVVSVHEEYIQQAMNIAQSQQITCEYSWIAGLALLLQKKDTLPTDKKMFIVNTGKTKYP